MEPNAYKVIKKIYATITAEEGEDKRLDASTIAYITGQLETLIEIYAPDKIDPEPRGMIDTIKQKLSS